MGDASGKSGNAGGSSVQKWQLPRMSSGVKPLKRNVQPKQVAGRRDGEVSAADAESIEKSRLQAMQQGYREGLERAESELAAVRQQLLDIINFFESPLQALNEEVEQELSVLAVTLAQQLVKREIRAEPGELIGVIRDAVKMLPSHSRAIRIMLNPEDADLVRTSLQLDEHDDELNWKLVEDPMISRGGCEIKSDRSVINATLEKRLQALAASVLGGDRSDDREKAHDQSD
jgi:flagellar assembly protein FliH